MQDMGSILGRGQGWGPKVGVNAIEKGKNLRPLAGTEPRFHNRTARSINVIRTDIYPSSKIVS
jgi:hypothetical protein